MLELFYMALAAVLLYFFFDILYFLVVHWVWVAGILGSILFAGVIFSPGSVFGSSTSSTTSPLQGDYTVYKWGGDTHNGVDRIQINKD